MKQKDIKFDVRPGEPIYLLCRYGRFVAFGSALPNGIAKIFSGHEHFEWYRRRYTTRILPGDRLIKYVPAAEDPKMEED